MAKDQKTQLDEATRRIAERMLRMPPKPHEMMKVGKRKPNKAKVQPEKKR